MTSSTINLIGLLFILLIIFGCSANDSDPSPYSDRITVKFTLRDLPNQIAYNKATTPDGRVEYAWGVTFDVTNDNTFNEGDLIIQILQFKSPGSTETIGTINDFNADLWMYTSETRTTAIAPASLTIEDNSIIITIDKSEHEDLNNITYSTNVYFSTTFQGDADPPQYDFNPSNHTYMSFSESGTFFDPPNDVLNSSIDMIKMTISL